MVRPGLHPLPLALATLLAGAVLLAPPLAGPAAAGGAGALDRPVDASGPGVEEAWFLASALDKRTVEEACPDLACCPLPGGLDHIANGGGARNEGHTTIESRGAPPNSVPVRADLYVGVIFPGMLPFPPVPPPPPPPPLTITVSFEGHPVVANLLGASAEPCWNPAGVYALYAANVLPFIPPWINGDYQVAGIPTFRNDGADPWTVLNNTLPLAEGASLVIIYSNAGVPAGSIVYTHTGPSTFQGGALNVFNPLAPALPAANFLRHTRIGADGQKGVSITPIAGIAADTTAIGGIQIKGPLAPNNQDSDWNGDDGGPLNQLWDTHTTDITGTIAAGAAGYVVNYFSPADCVSPSVHVLTAF
jgi:hypothetical protein